MRAMVQCNVGNGLRGSPEMLAQSLEPVYNTTYINTTLIINIPFHGNTWSSMRHFHIW